MKLPGGKVSSSGAKPTGMRKAASCGEMGPSTGWNQHMVSILDERQAETRSHWRGMVCEGEAVAYDQDGRAIRHYMLKNGELEK